MHAVLDAGAATFVAKGLRHYTGQAEPCIDLFEQQYTAIADDVAAIECGLDNAPADTSEQDSLIRTLWHRWSSVGMGDEYL